MLYLEYHGEAVLALCTGSWETLLFGELSNMCGGPCAAPFSLYTAVRCYSFLGARWLLSAACSSAGCRQRSDLLEGQDIDKPLLG